MVGVNHLGTAEELMSFVAVMNKELKKHKDEKHSMRSWQFESVMLNNIPEIQKRIEKISKLNIRIKNNLFGDSNNDEDKREITKQFIHIANFCMMGWLKSKENK